ncbi:MAG: ferritin-like domain-containing protein [Alphaproteobacteria bacterium PRO2]|nr:ferritin-like domain-containing protein [Alphaproteobacteria bacterium PRO2]
MKMKNLEELFEDELFDIYNGEQQLTKALPKMAEKATDPRLAEGFRSHLEETEGQVRRIEKIFELLSIKEKSEKCEAMKGLITEAEELIKNTDEGPVRDAAMITAAQKVEHYEIAAYGSLISLANTLGHMEAASILAETLEEERATDRRLSDLAEGGINREAMQEAA